jgi:hypothetical protein
MLNYPGHLVSLMALHLAGQETIAQLQAAYVGPAASGAPATTTYQLLWSHWPVWAPGERRTAAIVLVPRLAQDITFHLSVMFDAATTPAVPQRWSAVVRIPFQAAALVDRRSRALSFPVPVTGAQPVQRKGRERPGTARVAGS